MGKAELIECVLEDESAGFSYLNVFARVETIKYVLAGVVGFQNI